MNPLFKGTRLKRYVVARGTLIEFHVETNLGHKIILSLVDCSITGLAGECLTEDIPKDVATGDLLVSSKLRWQEHEYSLGRLVLRTLLKKDDGKCLLGFSIVDTKVPVDGPLSKVLEMNLYENKSPYDFEISPDKFNASHFLESNFSNIDLFAKIKHFQIFLNNLKNHNKFGFYNSRLPSKGARINLDRTRKSGRRDYIMMGSNDYLGLSSDERVAEAAKKAMSEYGFGSTGSPITTGITKIHEELCATIASIFRKDKAILFNSGYSANVGTITGLTNATDLLIADIHSHASIQDGMHASKATSRFFKHNDMEHLIKLLERERTSHNGALIVAEGIFSMDGDLAPMQDIVNIAREFNCRIMADEAHSFGVVGPTGLGALERFGVTNDVDIVLGTFSKICGGIGAFVTGSAEVIDWIYYFARSHMFSVALPPSTSAAMLEAIKIFQTTPELLINLRRNINHFVLGLRDLGFTNIPANHESSIIPLIVGDEKKLGIMNQVFLDSGVFVVPILYPAVGRTNARFRFTVMATHTISDLDFVLATLEKAMHKSDFKPGRKKIEIDLQPTKTSKKQDQGVA